MTAQDINKLFRDKGYTLGSVESFTGGLFASEIISTQGASHFFKGALVTYFTEEKVRILGMNYDEIDKYGVVSQETAGTMASHAQRILNVDYCISFTGNAGPDVMENKQVGEVYIGVSSFQKAEIYSYFLKGNRDEIRKQAVQIGYEILEKIINNISNNEK